MEFEVFQAAATGVAAAATAIAAWAAWAAANRSREAVDEMKRTREQDAAQYQAELTRRKSAERTAWLERIRSILLEMRDLVNRRKEGTEDYRRLRTRLQGGLAPPEGADELRACVAVSNASDNEATLIGHALNEVENRLRGWEGNEPTA